MHQPFDLDYTHRLRSLMQTVGFSSFKALAQAAGVSEWQIEQLRRGKAAEMRAGMLLQLSQALQITLPEILEQFSPLPAPAATLPSNLAQPAAADPEIDRLREEYQRLQNQLEQQRHSLQQVFQQASLQVLESWLLQFPTAVYAAQQNPELPAVRLLPLLRPIDQLLSSWGVESIAPVGAEIPYDPQQHQLMAGSAQPGEPVKVRYAGYRQGEKLLYRAKVSPASGSPA